MRHPTWGFELPEILARLIDWMGEDERRAELLERAAGDIDPALSNRFGQTVGKELAYPGHPFEFIPIFWNGGDALQYGLVVHSDGLAHRMASYAPGDDRGPRWLGDDASQGLGHLLAVNRHWAGRTAAWSAPGVQDLIDEHRRDVAAAVDELAAALSLEVPDELPGLTEGARSDRDVTPDAPAGWTFEECNDDVGVLAPSTAFDPDLVSMDRPFDRDAELLTVDGLLARGFPASALAVARNVYQFTAFDGDRGAAAARAMQRAYSALGREWLVGRVDAYLDDDD